MRGKRTAIAAVAIVLAGCGGSGHPAATVTSTVLIKETVTVTNPAPPTPALKTTMETDGTYRIGTDIEPGTYRSGGRSDEGESDCYWAKLHSLNPTDIVSNGLGNDPQVVALDPGDVAFLTHSCQPWRKD